MPPPSRTSPTVRTAPDALPGAPLLPDAGAGPRGTQSFVHIIGVCWRRPSLLGVELLWRWGFGIPLLLVLAGAALRVWAATAAAVRASGIFEFSLEFPMQGALQIAQAWQALVPALVRTAEWLLPLAVLAWAFAAGLGRNAVLRRYDRSIPWEPVRMVVLQLLRILALCGSFALWYALIRWASHVSLANPGVGAGAEPNLVLYCALVIIFSLGIFTLWGLLSWIFSIAPLLALVENRGIAGSLGHTVRLGRLTGKLIEINLVMNIVKLALGVLAMVFSATPLPFASAIQGVSLYLWWATVSLLYLLASDFFQVARIVAFVELFRIYRPGAGASPLSKPATAPWPSR